MSVSVGCPCVVLVCGSGSGFRWAWGSCVCLRANRFDPIDGSYDVSEIRLWNVSRSSADIQNFKDVRISTLNASYNGLIGVWRRVTVDFSTNSSVIKDETGLQPDAVVPSGSDIEPLSPEVAIAFQFPPVQAEPRWNEDPQGALFSFTE